MVSLSIPAAIVLGFGLLGTCVGLALYFGLRERPRSSFESHTDDGAVGRLTSSQARAGAEAPSSTADVSSTTLTARRAIDAQHAHLIESCWNPSFAQRATPAQVKLTLMLEYAEDGRLQVHSLQQDAAQRRSDVTICVNKELVMPVVDPPGQRVRVAVPILLP